MNYGTSWVNDLISAAVGIGVGSLGLLGTLKAGRLSADAIDSGVMARRLSDVEARADQMRETIYRKDRRLIAALEEAAEAKSAAERAEIRAAAAERRAAELDARFVRLEGVFDELLTRTRMPVAERDRLRALYQSAG